MFRCLELRSGKEAQRIGTSGRSVFFSQPVTCATRRIPGAVFGLPSLNETQQQQEVEAFSQVSGSAGNKQVRRWKTASIRTLGESSAPRRGIYNVHGGISGASDVRFRR